jgi:hypothetical protein
MEEVMDTLAVKISEKNMPLTKIFWNIGRESNLGNSVQITLAEHHGGQRLSVLTRMFDIACQDFPDANLDMDRVSAVVLGGDCRKGMWGIEFHVPAGTKIPSDYSHQRPELILAGGL